MSLSMTQVDFYACFGETASVTVQGNNGSESSTVVLREQIVSKAGKATAAHADDVALATRSLEILQGRDGRACHLLWLFIVTWPKEVLYVIKLRLEKSSC